jgi:hypothetical protein
MKNLNAAARLYADFVREWTPGEPVIAIVPGRSNTPWLDGLPMDRPKLRPRHAGDAAIVQADDDVLDRLAEIFVDSSQFGVREGDKLVVLQLVDYEVKETTLTFTRWAKRGGDIQFRIGSQVTIDLERWASVSQAMDEREEERSLAMAETDDDMDFAATDAWLDARIAA